MGTQALTQKGEWICADCKFSNWGLHSRCRREACAGNRHFVRPADQFWTKCMYCNFAHETSKGCRNDQCKGTKGSRTVRLHPDNPFREGLCWCKDNKCTRVHHTLELQDKCNKMLIGTPFCFSKFMGVRCRDGAECSFEHQGVFRGGLEPWALKGEQPLKRTIQGAKRPASGKDFFGAEAKAQKKDDQGYTQVETRKGTTRSPSSGSIGSEGSAASNASFLDLDKEITWPTPPSSTWEGPKQKPQANPLLLTSTKELRPDTRETGGKGHSGRGHRGKGYGGRGQGTAYRGDRSRGSRKGEGR